MSVLIKGGKMPKNCIECVSTLGLFSKTCPISDDSNIDEEFARNHIYDGCPLVEIPPHGRLIDADELKAIVRKGTVGWRYQEIWDSICNILDDAQTVIESEEE